MPIIILNSWTSVCTFITTLPIRAQTVNYVAALFFRSFRYPNLLNSDCEDALLEYLAAPDQNTKSRHLLIPSSDCLPLFKIFFFLEIRACAMSYLPLSVRE